MARGGRVEDPGLSAEASWVVNGFEGLKGRLWFLHCPGEWP